MEADDSTASPTPVKRERSPSPQPETDIQDSKRQAFEASGVVRAPVEFPWRTCQNLGDVERLKIKERAVKLAEEDCMKIRAVLESALAETPDAPDSKDAVMMGHKIINQWLVEHDNIRKAHGNLQILVGVEGPTGAGKSSFLGSLLRIPELFPSGQESAATAVVGKVSWNSEDDPGRAFRAEVIFRNKADVEAELESLLRELNRYSNLVANRFDDEDEDAISRADAKAESKNKIDHEVPKVKAVWGVGERDLQIAAARCPEKRAYADVVQSILDKNKNALGFLTKGSISFVRDSAKKLSRVIKPYLDSSPVNHNGTRFSPWPLVKEVHIYAKADILKSGITLVDLPGCGDATSSRSEVAQNFSRQLDVRMVVSPIIRATDEKQGQELMQSGFDEAQMRIRGKLDGNGFGVIISKMDELKVDSYIAGCDELYDDEEIIQKQDRLVELKEEKNSLRSMNGALKDKKRRAEGQKKKAQRSYESAKKKHALKLQANPNESDEHVSKLRTIWLRQVEACEQAGKEFEDHMLHQTRIGQEMIHVRHWLHHQAIQTRNRRVVSHIRSNFASRKDNPNDNNSAGQSQNEQEYVLPILPVSTKAFWQLESNEPPLEGFPSQKFTGIPAAEQWLHRATLGKREKHLDDMLDGYQSLMTMMRIYSQTNGQDGNFDFTRVEVEAAVAETHDVFCKKLAMKLAAASVEIEKLDPLEHKDRAMNKFISQAEHIAFRWAYKFPEENNSSVRLHWCTYYANISRMGQKFTSYSKPRVTYNWIESLASPVLKVVGKDWDSKMNKKLPKIRVPMMTGFSAIWTEYLDQLQQDIRTKVPSLEVTFNNMRPVLNNSQRATENRIRSTLGQLSQKAANVAFDAVEFLTEEMKPTFQTALEQTGRGSYQRRRNIINHKVKKDVEPMCNEMLNRLASGLAAKKAEVPGQLKEIAGEAIREVKQQLSFLVNNLVENSSSDSEKCESKAELQKNVRTLIEAWEETWAQTGDYEEHILDEDLSIPDSIPELELEEDTQYDEAIEDEDYEDES